MYIKKLMLLNYRNYRKLDIELGPAVNVFIGNNAQGKTNILESIYYCGFARSHRNSKDRELVNWNENNAYVSVSVSKDTLDKKIDINILKDGKKSIRVNSIKITKIGELIGVFNVVMFSPEDLKIVKESPGIRRRFIDMELCQLSNRYYYNLVQYNKVLNERNLVLKNRKIDEFILDVYDEQLSNFAEQIIKDRINYINNLNNHGKAIHKDITSGKEDIEFKYVSSVKDLGNIKIAMKEGLLKNRLKDIERRITSIGPHRDDFIILINNIDAKSYGSQGQQRTAVLTIKFASLNIIKDITKEYPVLLLDDVLSELDFTRKAYILNSIHGIQTLITCTGIEDISKYIKESAKVFNVKDGSVKV